MFSRPHDRKHVLVVRRTRLEELARRQGSLAQARFCIESQGGDFADYEDEHAQYQRALAQAHAALQATGRYQVIERAFLPNMVFGPDDLVITLGPDGLVANTLKYLDGQALAGINPDPGRWDGHLLPFGPADLPALLEMAATGQYDTQEVTMAEAVLSDGQRLLAVNDLFIGAQSHVSAQYRITCQGHSERQSSSGVIVSTGLGASGWMRSVLRGARRLAGLQGETEPPGDSEHKHDRHLWGARTLPQPQHTGRSGHRPSHPRPATAHRIFHARRRRDLLRRHGNRPPPLHRRHERQHPDRRKARLADGLRQGSKCLISKGLL